jgi:hypothetical protein
LSGHVGFDGDGRPAGGGDVLDDALCRGVVAAVDDGNLLAVGSEAFGGDPTDSAGAAGHDRNA